MKKIDVADLETREWTPKHYKKEGEIQYGYDVTSFRDEDGLKVPGAILNFVRVKPGHVIPEHNHFKKDEYFVVIGGEAKIQTRKSTDEEMQEMLAKTGDVFPMPPKTYHRVENLGNLPFYLFRVAFHNVPGDSHYIE